MLATRITSEANRRSKANSRGFTIVELLIVVAIIGIMAAVTIVAYNGISQKAVASALQSDLTNAANKLKLYQVDNSAYSTSLDCTAMPAANTICLKASAGDSYSYTAVNSTNPQTFSLTATNTNSVAYVVTNDSSPVATVAVPTGSQTFTYIGSIQTFTVPTNVTSLSITAKGAQGGSGASTGGLGASVVGTFGVAGGQGLSVLVGGQPAAGSAYPGGGSGTLVALGSSYASATPMIVGGGGGGSAGGAGQAGQILNVGTTANGGGSNPGSSGNGAPSVMCGGGGFYTSGGNDTLYGTAGAGGSGFRQGGAGGVSTSGYQTGGFGGGATAELCWVM